MLRHVARTIGSAGAAVLIGSSALSAQGFGQRATGLSSPAQTVTFDEGLADGTLLTNQYQALGIVFAGLAENSFPFLGSGFTATNFGNPALPLTSGFYGPFSILFNGTVSAAAFQLIGTNSSTPSTFTAFLNGSIVSTFQAFANNPADGSDWYGFENLTFDRIDVLSERSVNGAIAMDNVQFGSVTATPEPASLMLMATGLVGTAGFVRRRRRAVKG